MALDALSRDSVVVVHNEGTTVKDLGPNPTYQSATVKEIAGFVDYIAQETNLPGSATKGDMLFTVDSNKLCIYNGTAWVKVSLS